MGINYLLDTHVLLWWLFDDPRLDILCREVIQNPNHRIFVSSASAWEIATKYHIGKLPEGKTIVDAYSDILKTKQNSLNSLSLPPMLSEQVVYPLPIEILLIA